MSSELTKPGAELYCATCEAVFASGEMCPDDGTRLVRLAIPGDSLVGRELDGRYTVGEKLGEGGMGAVYRGRQHAMGREVAIKVLSAGLVKDAPSIKRFLREAKLASRLVHPNIVSVLDFGQTSDGLFYLVMELVAGRTLHDVIVRELALTPARIVRIGAQVCDALEGAHALPIIHRDLKPANIMVLATGRDLVKVLDFGLAKSLSPDASATTMTSAGALLGTPTFMPPEVANGEPVDHRADLYSLGCILYTMATGRPPFVTDSIPEMIALHGTAAPPRTTGVPAALAAVIDRLLAKDPGARYQTAASVREALEASLAAPRERGPDPILLDPVSLDPVPLDRLTVESMPPVRSSELVMTRQFTAPTPPVTQSSSIAGPASGRRGPILALVAAIAVTCIAILLVVLRSPREERSVAPVGPMASDAESAPGPTMVPPVDAAPAVMIDSAMIDAAMIDAAAPAQAIDAAAPAQASDAPAPVEPKRGSRKPPRSSDPLARPPSGLEPAWTTPPDAAVPEESPF